MEKFFLSLNETFPRQQKDDIIDFLRSTLLIHEWRRLKRAMIAKNQKHLLQKKKSDFLIQTID